MKILLVEDDPVLRKMYSDKLDSYGYNLVTASDGQEAYEKYQNEKPNIVITDIMLPRMSGEELLEKIKSTPDGANIPVIVCTNLTLDEEKTKVMELGASEYLSKESITLTQFVEAVKKYTSPQASNAPTT
ncbi:hypothetical protein A2955_05210 [Candidatus Woesebacteria bacterium RIFCSPLOWO2_01_FULL_37_19]|uniref:Response regulatory domain-containing protein n=2 Tax=Candidatus Woeseibacteriota TaxID=1752722 RepID=A0A1F8AZ39_9BACT|nr:MAG: hypothetical protein A2771_01340 [Candidatus Woesebacteria bacterium RIFCSPHIGHO2_01_FULL_38_26b]OGM57001.1 MAG: hypothetical protein A2955_05210 [Candidatus Woesebacteria bacterium RIFCSPLOWO2_01_FULL_37_19]